MENILLLILAAQCPKLAGTYGCVFPDGQYSPLVVSQKRVSADSEPERTRYSFDYTATPGEPEPFYASATAAGESDSFGWTSRCVEGELISISRDGSMKAEVYLDDDKNLVSTLNDKVVQSCPSSQPRAKL